MVNTQDNPGDAQDAPPLPRVLCARPLSHYARLADTSSKSGATASLNPNMDRAFIYKGLAPRSWSSKSRGEGGSQVSPDKPTGHPARQVGIPRRRPKGGGRGH